MKSFLNKNKILLSTVALITVLTVCLMLPQAFASKDEGGELFEEGSFVEEPNTKETVEEDNTSVKQNTTEKIDTEDEKTITTEPIQKITKNILGKKIEFKYKSTNKTNTQYFDDNELHTYKSVDDTEILVDSITGEIRDISFNIELNETTNSITKEQAEQIARNFAKQYCDLKKYDFCEITQLSDYFLIMFNRKIGGYFSYEMVNVAIDFSGNVTDFSKTPDIFDGIDVSKIVVDEAKIKQCIIEEYKVKYGTDFFDIEISDITITVLNSKVQAIVRYKELNEQGQYLYEDAYRSAKVTL